MAAEENDLALHIRLFGEGVARCRERSRMSREDLCRKAGIAMETLCRIEEGAAGGDFGLLEICSLAKALELQPDELMKCYEDGLRVGWW